MLKSHFRRSLNIKYALQAFFRKNKILIVVLGIVALLGVLTGVLVAVKSGITHETASNFDICLCVLGDGFEFGTMWDCFFSILLNLLVLSIASLWVFLLPVGFVVVAYRGYLLGFNAAVLVILFGFGGAISSILVILPCQLAILLVEICFCALMVGDADCKKKYGRRDHGFLKCFLSAAAFAFLLCLVEAVLLFVFSASTILVI